jgi:hypothetical protein
MTSPDIRIDTDRLSRLKLAEQIDVLTMSPGNRRRLLKKIGTGVRKETRGNIQKQNTVSGQPMEPRASKKKRRMMSKMSKGMITRIEDDHSAVVTWKNPGQAMVADRHHRGIPEEFTAKKAARIYGRPNYGKPATPAQAKSLNKEGYRRLTARKRGKGKAVLKRVSQKWIRENMTQGQAGLILRLMRTDSTKGVQSWSIKVPPRPILGATPENAQIYLTAMAREALQQIKRK